MRIRSYILAGFLSIVSFGASLAEPPAYLGITLGETRDKAQAILEERFPEAPDPAVFEDEKTIMIIYKNLDATYQKLTLHFHPNGKLSGMNVTMPLEKEELLLELLPVYGTPTKPTKRGYVWKLEGNYQINATVFEKGSITLKLMDRKAYEKWGRPWLDSEESD